MKRKIKNILFWVISLTWGLPMTLMGMIFFIWNIIFNRILLVEMRLGRVVVFLKGRWGGVSLGAFVFTDEDMDEGLVWHEMGHTIQSLIWGPLTIFVIFIPSFIRAAFWPRILKKNPKADYDSIWFEGQATKFGEKLKNGGYF